MPVDPAHYTGIHTFYDTNYVKHIICNLCANKNWSRNLTCFCGNNVHEIDMFQIKPYYLISVSKNLDSEIYNYLSSKLNLAQDEKAYMYITKACSSCATHNDTLKHNYKEEALLEPITVERIVSFDFNSDFSNHPKEILLTESFYKDDLGNLKPAVYLSVKITNPGYVGYFVKESNLF